MKPKAQTLFHFTKSVDVLQKIFTDGFWPRYSLEDFRWQIMGPTDHDFAAFPMVCFCDIPLSRIGEHVDFYGHYGIGLSRAWGERTGANPLLYIADGSNSLANSLIELANVSRRHNPDDSASATYLLQHTASFTKPVSGQMTIDTEQVEKDFYQESEWRYVPNLRDRLPQFLSKSEFNDGELLANANQKTRDVAMLTFTPTDVRYIFVQFDNEIPAMINFIQSKLGMYPAADRNILISRVTSLETVRGDW